MKTYWRQLSIAVILSGFSLTAAVGLLSTSAWLISMASTRPPILVLEVAIVGVRFFGLSRGLLKYSSRIIEHDVALKIQTNLRIQVYKSLSNMVPTSFNKLKRGNLLSQVVTDIDLSQDIWLRIISPWASVLISGVSGLGIIYWLSPLAGNAVALIFLIAVALVPFIATLNSSAGKTREQESQLFNQVMQIAESAPESLIFGYQQSLIENLELAEDSISYQEKKSAKLSGIATMFHFICLGIASISALYFASKEFSDGNLAGVNVAVISLLPLIIFEGISALPSAFSNLYQIISAKQNVKNLIIDAQDELDSPTNPVAKEVSIDFVDLVPIMEGVSLPHLSIKVECGETLIISGRSGVGKSSVINALIGSLPFTGQIKVNGENLTPKHQSLFSTLLQDDYLFTTSIRENLKIGNPKASDRDLEQMLEVVELGELIHKLPEGLDTHIGPLGYNFSGGEKQRLKLARILLRNTPAFILDEPFEFLDSHQVDRLAKKVARVLTGKTVIIVSHLDLPIEAKNLVLSS